MSDQATSLRHLVEARHAIPGRSIRTDEQRQVDSPWSPQVPRGSTKAIAITSGKGGGGKE